MASSGVVLSSNWQLKPPSHPTAEVAWELQRAQRLSVPPQNRTLSPLSLMILPSPPCCWSPN